MNMIDKIIEMLSYPFIGRAVLVGTLVALCAALLGVSLVLKRFSMIGDGLSHIGFGALAIATALNLAPLAVSVPIVIIAAFLLLRLNDASKLKGDSAIALISCGSLAVGVMIISFSGAGNVDITNYMFGSILAVTKTDAMISVILSVAVITAYLLCYSRIFSVTFDESFAKATGMRTNIINMTLALLCALTIVVGMRLVGSMLISALIIFPALSSMRVFGSFKSVVISSGIISVVCFLFGLTASYMLSTPAGASVVCANILAYLVFYTVGKIKK